MRHAEAEGLALLKSERSSTGYKGVRFKGERVNNPYRAEVQRGGKTVTLGHFATVEEAALVVARTPERRAAAPPAPPPLTAEEAVAQAEAEGLTLIKSASSSTGYKSVHFDSRHKTRPYSGLYYRAEAAWEAEAEARRGGPVFLGQFATAQEAALHVARAKSTAQAAPPQLPATSSREPNVALLPVPLHELSVAQVGELLHRLGLGKYAEAFAEFPVDGACLVVADAADLEEAGMGPAMHRKKFLAALTELMAA